MSKEASIYTEKTLIPYMAPLACREGTQVSPQLDVFYQDGYLYVVLCTSAHAVAPPGAAHYGEAQYSAATEVRIQGCSAGPRESVSSYQHNGVG